MEINIHNFRNFNNQKLKFSRVNILIGENSGGKSSLLKLLLSLKQTIDSPFESNLKLRGDYTDLGNYQEVVKDKDKSKKIEFGFKENEEFIQYFLEFTERIDKKNDEKETKVIIDILNAIGSSHTSVKFSLNSKLNNHENIDTIIQNESVGKITLKSKRNEDYDSQRELSSSLIFELGDINFTLEDCTSFKEGFFTLFDGEIKRKIFDLEIENHLDIYYRIIFLLIYQNYCLEYIDGIRFVNPIGNSPKRLYFQEDTKSNHKLIDIEKLINILGDPSMSSREFNTKLKLLNKVIKLSGIAEEIELIKNNDLPVLALNVKTKGFWANITDVGYGVSLQLPILFQAILSEKFSKNKETLLIEQPEVHLHPSLQSKFIETLLSLGERNKYFIETHSEHIIRKLQVLIKNNEFDLTSKDVTIHYFKGGSDKFEITSHTINENGKLAPKFPSGFFDNSYNLIKDLL
jgi:predicted ATPase